MPVPPHHRMVNPGRVPHLAPQADPDNSDREGEEELEPPQPSRQELRQRISELMDQDWSMHYSNCPVFGGWWTQVHTPGETDWPQGVQLFAGKMYWNEKLCVPKGLGEKVVMAVHLNQGHPGVRLPRNWWIPATLWRIPGYIS